MSGRILSVLKEKLSSLMFESKTALMIEHFYERAGEHLKYRI